ncbi:FAS1-like dehydratase domain-containing protein [Shinella pollutisoli]|uniref:MaoC family dehydratase N-terminal domain-containing protein n=1 Tax=Shinella pollutisoli TaxID=2250594 RepID=A0ABV7DLK7_9HYPH|nr:MaoC family dehydratase N-terminal domain-containing protein [Shinella pollutisoli]
MSASLDIDHLRTWIGAERRSTDVITPRLANGLAAVLDRPCDLAAGNPAPPGIHWCLAPEIAPMSALGSDGHPARGVFMPPVPLPRRMWAGGELRFSGAFRVGDEVRRVSRIADVAEKAGRTGTLCFVTISHDYSTAAGLVLSERQDLVYRAIEAPPAGEPRKADLPQPDRRAEIEGTATLLMRYSAVTFNGHRIHYDRDYCRNEELYPGLVVHGPLQATFLLQMAVDMDGGRLPSQFGFRATAPLFDGTVFSLNGRREDDVTRLWVVNDQGVVTMEARSA